MAKKSAIAMEGLSSMNLNRQEPRRSMNETEDINAEVIKINIDNNNSTEFDPKAVDMKEWCPVYHMGKNHKGGDVYMCSITDSITYTNEYIALLDCLHNAGDNDIIELNINSPGGYITTATQICSAIRQCKGDVYTHATGICASAGSLIWSVGDKVSVGDTANFMWHMSSHFDCGNSISIAEEAEFQVAYVQKILLDISLKRGFITEEEVARICTNPQESVWISADEMRKRIYDFHQKEIVA